MQANDAEINQIRAKKLLANELGITFVSFSQNNHDPSKLVAETPCELLRYGRDANRNYDPRTLYLPPDFFKSLTGGQDVEVVKRSYILKMLMLIEERCPGDVNSDLLCCCDRDGRDANRRKMSWTR